MEKEFVTQITATADRRKSEESAKVQQTSLNIMEDLEKRKKELEESHNAYLNIIEDMEKKSNELKESQEASLNIM